MKSVVPFSVLAISLLLTVVAEPASAGVKTAPAAAVSTAAAPVGPAARDLARKVLVASGADTSNVAPSEATMNQALAGLSNALPAAKPDWRPVMEQAVRDEIRAYGQRRFEGEIDIYASRLTQAQLTDILAFYNTPSGQALAAQSEAIGRDRQAVTRKAGADLMQHMIAAVCAKEPCAPPGPPPQGTSR